MSGFLGIAAFGQATAISGILFGGGAELTLGDFAFANFEVPERIEWGGTHRLNVHKFPGGGRVINSMGPDNRALSWSGTFLSPDAEQRAYQVDAIRIAGQPVALAWGDHNLIVVVSDFAPTTMGPGRTTYRITCEVLQDMASAPGASPPTLMGQISDDISSATGIDLPATLSAAGTALQTVQQVAQIANIATGGKLTGVLSAVTSAQGAFQSAGAIANEALDAFGGTGAGLLPDGLLGALSSAQTAAAAQAAGGFLGRVATNIGSALP